MTRSDPVEVRSLNINNNADIWKVNYKKVQNLSKILTANRSIIFSTKEDSNGSLIKFSSEICLIQSMRLRALKKLFTFKSHFLTAFLRFSYKFDLSILV